MPASGQKTILVIEDEADIRNFASKVLQFEGYNVLQAADGDQGLSLVTQNHVDLVLVDLRMPGRDGWSVLEEIKANPELSEIKVIVLTASAGVPLRDKAIDMGAIDYIVKPLSASGLKEAAAKALKN